MPIKGCEIKDANYGVFDKDSVKNKLSFWRPDLRQIRASRFRKTAGVVVLH